MKYQILNRFNDTIIDEREAESKREAILGAIRDRKDLRYANLSNANLSNADLRDADLSNANLRYANLSNADLRDANLSNADLSNANLRDADLRDADLRYANLSNADLSNANLSGIEIPTVSRLHSRILEAVEANPKCFNMSNWHNKCGTAHCRAGFAIHLAGEEGYALEKAIGSNAAGALITMASCPWMEKVPNFLASDEEALIDIKKCAEREAGAP